MPLRNGRLQKSVVQFKADFVGTGAYDGNRIYDLEPEDPKPPKPVAAQYPTAADRRKGEIESGKLPAVYKVLKCSEYDYRVFHLCPKADFFQANARVYFDNGEDEEGEVDLFKNGNLEPALQFAAVRLPWRFGRSDAFDPWSWGPEFSAGLGTPAAAEEGEEDKSTAPIVLVSAGLRLTYMITEEGSNFAFEVGRVWGFTTDEAFGDNDDSATYVGIKIKYVPAKD